MFMAVQADHLHLLPHQLIQSREIMSNMQSFQSNMHSAAPMLGASMPISGDAAAVIPLNHDIVAASAVGFLPRKRRMNSDDEFSSFQDVYELEINQMINLHVEKVRMEVAARRRRFARRLAATVERAAATRLEAKEEEVLRIKTLNSALEERIKTLIVESRSWRELAAAKEAEAGELRSSLQQAIVEAGREAREGNSLAGAAEEAESCCDDNRGGSGEIERSGEGVDGDGGAVRRRWCRQCCSGEASVVLLPCRHLCVCVGCGSHVSFCPVCYSCKKGSINVSLA